MNITIINGTPETGWEEYEKELFTAVDSLSNEHHVNLFTVRDMTINYCRGCFSCWVKSPGLCVFRDDMDKILGSYVDADYIVLASPLKAGFLTSQTKKTMDRLLPLILPYINLFDGECHHPKRYDNDPVLGLIVFDKNTDERSVEITFSTIDRLSLNFHSKRTFKALVRPDNLQEVLKNEISNN